MSQGEQFTPDVEASKSAMYDSHPIIPVYRQREPNASIDLGEIQVSSESIATDPHLKVTARAEMKFLPADQLEIFVPARTGNQSLGIYGPFECRVDFPELGGAFDAYRIRRLQDASVYIPRQSPVQLCREASTIKKAVFNLFNWPKFLGRDGYGLKTPTSFQTCGRVILEFDEWKVTIAETEDTRQIIEQLEDVGGYAITHAGCVEKLNGTEFTSSELDDVLGAMTYFFSFMLGRWSGPSLTVGRSASNEIVFQHWGIGHVSRGPWVGGHSCIDKHHFEMMSDAVQAFWARWKDTTWKRPLSHAIHWYVSANDTSGSVNVDTGLLFTQSALELLAWTYCVSDRKIVPPKKFKSGGLSAADKFRLLASSMSIPLAVPPQLDAMKTHPTKEGPWSDTMQAITQLRNGLVHPGNRENSIAPEAYRDAWNFSLWFISMVILRLFGYQGKYGNRLKRRFAGEVEPVPWVTST